MVQRNLKELDPLEVRQNSDWNKVDWILVSQKHGACVLEPHFPQTQPIHRTAGQGDGEFDAKELV